MFKYSKCLNIPNANFDSFLESRKGKGHIPNIENFELNKITKLDTNYLHDGLIYKCKIKCLYPDNPGEFVKCLCIKCLMMDFFTQLMKR